MVRRAPSTSTSGFRIPPRQDESTFNRASRRIEDPGDPEPTSSVTPRLADHLTRRGLPAQAAPAWPRSVLCRLPGGQCAVAASTASSNGPGPQL